MRYQKSIGFLRAVEGLPLYVPKIFRVELIAVARRLGFKGERRDLLRVIEKLNLIGEDNIINIAEYVAGRIHPRAVDAYYSELLLNSESISTLASTAIISSTPPESLRDSRFWE